MKRIACISLFFAAFLFIAASCEKENPDDNGDSLETVSITEDLSEATVWEGNKVYIIEKYDFYVEDSLEIQAGAIVKFTEQGSSLTLGSDGVLKAEGTASSPVVFTSIKDDSRGGDSNEDGENTSPARADWSQIDLNGESGSFEYCHFYYGGSGQGPTLRLSAEAVAAINHCTFAHNQGIIAGSQVFPTLNAREASAETEIQNCLFYDNVVPLGIYAEISLDNSNQFHNPDIGTEMNDYNGIFVKGNGIDQNVTWSEDEVAFVLDGLNVNVGSKLILGDNVVLKFKEDTELTLFQGISALNDDNGVYRNVYYTSYKDDDHKGDTNGDGNATSPGETDWKGVYLDDFRAGYADWGNILYDSGTPA